MENLERIQQKKHEKQIKAQLVEERARKREERKALMGKRKANGKYWMSLVECYVLMSECSVTIYWLGGHILKMHVQNSGIGWNMIEYEMGRD